MGEKLDKEKVRKLLEEADRKWFLNNTGIYKYGEHLDFMADYLARNYYSGTTGNQRAVSGTPKKRKNRGQ